MTDPFNKMVWYRTIDKRGLTPTAVLVLGEMHDRANMDGTAVYGSQVNIAEKIGKSVESVRRAQRQLRDRGLVKLLKSGSNYGSKSNSFVLTYPDPKQTSPVKSSPGIGPDRSKADRSFQSSPVIHEGLTGHFGASSPVTGEGLIDPVPDPGPNPGLGNEGTSPVIRADRSNETEPHTGFAADGPLPPQSTDQPTEENNTVTRNSTDPWATPVSAVATDDIWSPQPVAVEAATDHKPTPHLGPAYPDSYRSLDEVIPPAPLTPQLVRRSDGSFWDPFAN